MRSFKNLFNTISQLFSSNNSNQDETQQDEEEEFCYKCGDLDHYTNQCHTYKTKMCWFKNRKGYCNNKYCTFAHSKQELRRPTSPLETSILFRQEFLEK